MWPFRNKPEPTPDLGTYAHYLLGVKAKSEHDRDLVGELAKGAWSNAKIDMEQAAREERRNCVFLLRFASIDDEYRKYIPDVTKRLILIGKYNGISIKEPISWNDRHLLASW